MHLYYETLEVKGIKATFKSMSCCDDKKIFIRALLLGKSTSTWRGNTIETCACCWETSLLLTLFTGNFWVAKTRTSPSFLRLPSFTSTFISIPWPTQLFIPSIFALVFQSLDSSFHLKSSPLPVCSTLEALFWLANESLSSAQRWFHTCRLVISHLDELYRQNGASRFGSANTFSFPDSRSHANVYSNSSS